MNNFQTHKSKIIRFSTICSILIVLFLACDDEFSSNVPYAYVNVQIDMQNPLYIDLQYVGGVSYVEYEGYNNNGIIVYHSGIDEFKAYDRTCPFRIEQDCAIEKDENSIVNAICPCCNSVYELNYGSVSQGPALQPLKEYRTSYNGTVLNIFN